MAKELEAVKEDLLGPAFQYFVDKYLADLRGNFAFLGESVQSPIEERFLSALIIVADKVGCLTTVELDTLQTDVIELNRLCPSRRLTIRPQYRIGDYIADFLITATEQYRYEDVSVSLAVECDGREFHHSSDDQITNDKKRDRYFASQGYFTLRYTGSELFHNSHSCATEVLECLVLNLKRKLKDIQGREVI